MFHTKKMKDHVLKGLGADAAACLPELLCDLACAETSGLVVGSEPRDSHRSALLGALEGKGMVSSAHVEGEEPVWRLTEDGIAVTHTGVPLRVMDSTLIMRPRDLPIDELCAHELVRSLELQGWTCKIATSKKQLRKVRSTFYDVNVIDASRVFWFKISDDAKSLTRQYLILLLTAKEHKKPVPHLADLKVYKKMLDPDYEPK